MPSRRALLYMPGDGWKKIAKSLAHGDGKRRKYCYSQKHKTCL